MGGSSFTVVCEGWDTTNLNLDHYSDQTASSCPAPSAK
jgi:hypothetical protein